MSRSESKEHKKMTNLKTLKDFVLSDNEDWICTGELKAEAVKRWKYAKEEENKTDDLNLQFYWRGRMDELEDNFNLTEDDLK